MIPTYCADDLSNPSIAFPLRLQQGLLQKTDERETYLMLLGVMASTPRGSWSGHPFFGFQEFFPEIAKEGLSEESRARIAATTTEQINSVLLELGLTRYRVDSMVLDPLPKDRLQPDGGRGTGRPAEGRGVILMLRESGSDSTVGHAL